MTCPGSCRGSPTIRGVLLLLLGLAWYFPLSYCSNTLKLLCVCLCRSWEAASPGPGLLVTSAAPAPAPHFPWLPPAPCPSLAGGFTMGWGRWGPWGHWPWALAPWRAGAELGLISPTRLPLLPSLGPTGAPGTGPPGRELRASAQHHGRGAPQGHQGHQGHLRGQNPLTLGRLPLSTAEA